MSRGAGLTPRPVESIRTPPLTAQTTDMFAKHFLSVTFAVLAACAPGATLTPPLTAQSPGVPSPDPDLESGSGSAAQRGALGGQLRPQPASDAELELRMTPIVRAVQQAQDSVVCIDLLNAQAVASRPGRQVRPEGQGSGVILDADGLVITNWHVVAPVAQGMALRIQVRLHDGRQFYGRLLSSSPEHDLALVQMELGANETVQPARVGASESLMVGETLIAIGNPQGHAHTVTSGVLSAIDREITVRAPDGRARTYSGLLQTDAAINQGNSGGALLDITGRLIGINNAMAMGSENIGFAIPIDTVRVVFEEVLLNSSNLTGPFQALVFGFRTESRDDGLVIRSVEKDSPADLAGIRVGDRLLRMGAKTVARPIDLARSVATARADEPIEVELGRDGGSRRTRLVPIDRGAWTIQRLVGTRLEVVKTEAVRTQAARLVFGRRAQRPFAGVLRVAEIEPDSPAAEAGLEAGDLLLGVKRVRRSLFREQWVDVPVEAPVELADQLLAARGRDVPILVERDGRLLEGPLFVPRD